jgi:hypothetical protein
MNGGTKAWFSTISLGRLQCVRQDSAGPTERRRRRYVAGLTAATVYNCQGLRKYYYEYIAMKLVSIVLTVFNYILSSRTFAK